MLKARCAHKSGAWHCQQNRAGPWKYDWLKTEASCRAAEENIPETPREHQHEEEDGSGLETPLFCTPSPSPFRQPQQGEAQGDTFLSARMRPHDVRTRSDDTEKTELDKGSNWCKMYG